MSESENSARPRCDFIYTKNSARPRSDFIYTKNSARPKSSGGDLVENCCFQKVNLANVGGFSDFLMGRCW